MIAGEQTLSSSSRRRATCAPMASRLPRGSSLWALRGPTGSTRRRPGFWLAGHSPCACVYSVTTLPCVSHGSQLSITWNSSGYTLQERFSHILPLKYHDSQSAKGKTDTSAFIKMASRGSLSQNEKAAPRRGENICKSYVQ